MGITITTPQGTDATELYQLRDSYGQPVTTLTGNEPILAEVWRGGDQPVLFSPTCTWEDPTTGKFLCTFLGSDNSSLEAGKYQVRITVAGVPIPDSTLVLTSSPGNAPALKAYCTMSDMQDYFSDISEILDPADETGFGRQRAKARSWCDRVIQANRRNTAGYTSYGLGSALYYGYCSQYNTQAADPILQGYLDADQLILSPTIVEANAKMALSYACQGEIGPGGQADPVASPGRAFQAGGRGAGVPDDRLDRPEQ